MRDVKVTVKSVRGECAAGCKKGDYFVVKEGVTIVPETSDGVCLYALSAMLPYLTAACRDTPADDWINVIDQLQCPDATNTVIFGLERVG